VVQEIDVDPVSGMVTKVRLDIHVPPDFPEKYRDALVRSAEQCAVKKHLEHPPQFEVTTRVEPQPAGGKVLEEAGPGVAGR